MKEEVIVLIDDDKLIHMSWEFAAKKKNIKLSTFFTVDDFLKNQKIFDTTCSVYIDSNLGPNISGEIESEKIFAQGFKNLYITTGYHPDKVSKPHWIKQIISKTPPF